MMPDQTKVTIYGGAALTLAGGVLALWFQYFREPELLTLKERMAQIEAESAEMAAHVGEAPALETGFADGSMLVRVFTDGCAQIRATTATGPVSRLVVDLRRGAPSRVAGGRLWPVAVLSAAVPTCAHPAGQKAEVAYIAKSGDWVTVRTSWADGCVRTHKLNVSTGGIDERSIDWPSCRHGGVD
jgi:hypothetical protein